MDTEADKRLDAIVAANPSKADEAKAFRGRVAVANAKLAYALFQEKFSGARWEALASRGARVQRPLWASTSAKNPAYRDVVYVEDLIGPDTVNTMPPATITAFADHGVVKRTVDTNIDEERALIAKLEKFGVPLKANHRHAPARRDWRASRSRSTRSSRGWRRRGVRLGLLWVRRGE